MSNPVPGKPCIFPFVYPDCSVFPTTRICYSNKSIAPLPHYRCIPEAGYEWCSTRTHLNNTHIQGEYGKCSPQCKPNNNSTENLASLEFQYLWDQGFYRLFDDDIGHCHTYNPGHRSSTSPDEKLIMLLGEL